MKICLITHIADPDGAMPIILSKLVFDNLDHFSCEKSEVDEILKKVINEDYSNIYIVDLNMSEEMAKIINENEVLKNKILVFDHHESELHLNKYPFVNVIVENNGRKECGTTLYYNYLRNYTNNSLLDKESTVHMVELIRENDTFDFIDENKEEAINFRNLYDIYGRDEYINHFTDFIIKNDYFEFTGVEKELVKIESERANRYVLEKLSHVRKATINNIPVGIVFAEQNRSMLGHKMAETMSDIDIAIVINVDRGVSYRADKEEVNTNILAIPCGGGGHKHASGSPLPNDLQEKIVEYIFKNVTWR